MVGGGAWGVALAAAAARKGRVLLYSRRAHDGSVPAGVEVVQDLARVGAEAGLVFFAVPSTVAADVARKLGDHLDGHHFVVHGVRGLVGENLDTIAHVLREETPARRIGALGGPALADNLVAGRPSVLVCGSHYPEVNHAVEGAFQSTTMRVYTTEDLRGLEWASALVGCLAIGVGYAQGLGLSPGLSAAIISRSVQEAARIAQAAGGDERTLLGLAGYGDLLACVSQHERPEVALGEALAKGRPLKEALAGARQRVEAVDLVPRVVDWAERAGVRCPIFTALTRGVLAGRPPEQMVHELMTGPVEDRA